MAPIDAHAMAHATLIGHIDFQSAAGEILFTHCLINALLWCYHSSCDFGGSAEYPPVK